ncbi:hypothetical protein [Salmonella phage PVPSE1]|uniref:Uncharacterized protein 244 n=1 Tax=Salmonella phage PVPSE1 TaxID=889338 RepID=G3BMB0_9CAUD|nr:hypothetical protein PVP-SE1_gp244 [Salmonella phage PVPSE1]ADP02640.1 hypothetical protein [Salmonella phage PVPSE1]
MKNFFAALCLHYPVSCDTVYYSMDVLGTSVRSVSSWITGRHLHSAESSQKKPHK